jgi:hypothetical protein
MASRPDVVAIYPTKRPHRAFWGCDPLLLIQILNPVPWRGGRGIERNLDHSQVRNHGLALRALSKLGGFERVSRRSRPEYVAALRRLEDLPTKTGRPAGELPVSSISARAADLYAAVRMGFTLTRSRT